MFTSKPALGTSYTTHQKLASDQIPPEQKSKKRERWGGERLKEHLQNTK